MARKTTEQFIADARKTHGDKYDYSKVEYKGNKIKVCVICPIHGEFMVAPNSHLRGVGCRKCYDDKQRLGLQHIAINDIPNSTKLISYRYWQSMITRCYSNKYQQKHPTYQQCSTHKDWLLFSNFKQWFDQNYIEGYDLDKDILIKGNKVYSPQTCCFVPNEINKLLTKNNKHRGTLPIGVTLCSKGGYISRVGHSRKYIGFYNTIDEAFESYKQAKESHIKEVATQYFKERLITERVYNALMNYEVEITD